MKDVYHLPFLAIAVAFLSAKAFLTALTLGDALAFGFLLGLYGFIYFHQGKKQKPVNEDVYKKLADLEDKANKLSLYTAFKKPQ